MLNAVAMRTGNRILGNAKLTKQNLGFSAKNTSTPLGQQTAHDSANSLSSSPRFTQQVKSHWFDKHKITLPDDKHVVTVSQKASEVMNLAEKTTQDDFQKLERRFHDLPRGDAQLKTDQASDLFNNGFSSLLRRYVRDDLQPGLFKKPKHFTTKTGLDAGLKSVRENLQTIDHLLDDAQQAAKQTPGVSSLPSTSRLASQRAVDRNKVIHELNETKDHVDQYIDALDHVVVKSVPAKRSGSFMNLNA